MHAAKKYRYRKACKRCDNKVYDHGSGNDSANLEVAKPKVSAESDDGRPAESVEYAHGELSAQNPPGIRFVDLA